MSATAAAENNFSNAAERLNIMMNKGKPEFMMNKSKEIEKWEAVEVERSASEAQKEAARDLIADEKNIGRYLSPPAETCFYLEYSYSPLGDIAGKTVLDYGCGTGGNSLILAKRGAKVVGVDIRRICWK